MTDGRVRTAIEQMETWLADPAWEPDSESLAQWNAEFTQSLAEADKGSGWPELLGRAHAAGQILEGRIAAVVEEQDRVKADLEAQDRGNRALRGYGANTR